MLGLSPCVASSTIHDAIPADLADTRDARGRRRGGGERRHRRVERRRQGRRLHRRLRGASVVSFRASVSLPGAASAMVLKDLE